MKKTSFDTRGIFHLSDEKFVKTKLKKQRKIHPLDTYKFRSPSIFPQRVGFEQNSVPIVFQVTPETLLNLAARVVDALSLPNVHDWTNADVCKWIRQYGYPQYQNTFRVNLITGRKLLLVDAQALSAMNIKQLSLNCSFILSDRCSVFQAEIYAIDKAAKTIRLMDFPPASLTILVASQGVIKALASAHINSRYATE
ncbi:uncharacterized protein LOC129253355 [Anastrepha obliqua]|uniref:uncharacterized protein LOC129253355 n=1 Tax=Anastrepha obliqua TaxID=95512 RepID=UPI002409AD9F|nr:uncharacterized protein LOC129253355 [Anastrepha obliqua]